MTTANRLFLCFTLFLTPVIPLGAQDITPDATLKNFYNEINIGNCEGAKSLRPDYGLERCERVSEVVIHEASNAFNNDSDSVLLISIDIYTDNSKSYFSGYVRLKNKNNRWQIIGPYKSQDNYTLAEYIADFVPKAEVTETVETPRASPPENYEAASALPVEIRSPADMAEEEEKIVSPEIVQYLSGEKKIEGNYTRLLNDLSRHLPTLAQDQIILVDRSRSSIYIYNKSNLLLGFFPILSALTTEQLPNGLYQPSTSEAGNKKNGSVHLNHLLSISETPDNSDVNYYIRDILDSDTAHSLLLSPIDLKKLHQVLSQNVLMYIGN